MKVLSDKLLSATPISTDSSMSVEKLNEAMELIKALAPKEAPKEEFLLKGRTGLNIIKNDMLPEDTVVVSKRLFDLIYESGSEHG